MTDREKINRVFWISLIVLGIAAAIRISVFPPQPPAVVPDVMEQWAETSTPECAQIIREESKRLDRENSTEDAQTKTFLMEEARIQTSNISGSEKEIRLRRLAEKDDIKEAAQGANSDVAFMNDMRKLEEAGCVKK